MKIRLTIVEGLSYFGNAEPRMQFEFPQNVSYREANSCLYSFAAETEHLSVVDDPWAVVVDKENNNVHLDLAYDANSPSDRTRVVKRGMDVLRSVLQEQARIRNEQ